MERRDLGGVAAGQEEGGLEEAAVTIQVVHGSGQDQSESRGGHSLQPASALLSVPSKEGKAWGAFQVMAFDQVVRDKM